MTTEERQTAGSIKTRPIPILRLGALAVAAFSLVAILLSCSKSNPSSSEDNSPALSPGEHRVVYEVTGTDGREVNIQWVSSRNQHQSETVTIPATREAIRSDSDYVFLLLEYKPASGAIAIVRGKILVDGAEWRSGSDAGNFLNVELTGVIGEP